MDAVSKTDFSFSVSTGPQGKSNAGTKQSSEKTFEGAGFLVQRTPAFRQAIVKATHKEVAFVATPEPISSKPEIVSSESERIAL